MWINKKKLITNRQHCQKLKRIISIPNQLRDLSSKRFYNNSSLINMGLEQPLLNDQINTDLQLKLINDSQDDKMNAMLTPDKPASAQLMRRVKFIITVLTIILTSFQVYDITTNKLQHSRNFTRFLNYYLIEHTYLDIYWAGQYMLNYPVQEYFLMEDVNTFLQRFQDTMKTLDQSVYGSMDHDEFLNRKNKVLLQTKKGQTLEYQYIISHGFRQPFQTGNIDSLKRAILTSQQIQIVLQPFYINKHLWHLMVSITTFSESSIVIQIYANEEMSLLEQHILTFIMGLIFLAVLLKQYLENNISWVDNVPEYLECLFLLNTFFVSLDVYMNVKWLVILDGIQCLVAWLLILKFLQKQDDYHISFLIRKSYGFVGKLFVSFGPIFIAFTVFGYTLFCRQAWQFSTFRRTFFTLFYISYYNATYESFVVTSRANPISMIFFFSFVILFTICVYSGMLVSVFCSYVWNKRQSKVKQDIVNNLKIQCSQCNYKYKYIDCVKIMKESKRTLKMSFIMQVDFSDANQRHKYKKMILKKCKYLTERTQNLLLQSKKIISNQKSPQLREFFVNQVLKILHNKIKVTLKQQFPKIEENNNQKDNLPKGEKQKNL